MNQKWLKLILSIIGTTTIGTAVISSTSCSENGLSPKVISQILQTYSKEAIDPTLDDGNDGHVVNVGVIGEFPSHTPKAVDIQNWSNSDSKEYKEAVADAVAWADEINAPIKSHITENIKNGKSLTGQDDANIKNITGYETFRDQYFTVHFANIYAHEIGEDPDSNNWTFEWSDDHEKDNPFQSFLCLQSESDNQKWRNDNSYLGSEYLNPTGEPRQEPTYLGEGGNEFYRDLELRYLWSSDIFDQETPYKSNIEAFSNDGTSIVTISYLVTFSPKPYTQEAPPVAFYVNADLRCSGIE